MIRFREAEDSDIEAVAALHAQSWRRAYRGILRDEFLDGALTENRRALWRKRLGQPARNQYVLLAIDAHVLAGFACVYGAEDAQWGSMLDNLHVEPELRGRGIGAQLIGQMARWSDQRHAEVGFYLWVFEKNHPARRFYERLGATHSESVEIDVPGGGRAVECRYTWPTAKMLIERTQAGVS